MIDKQRAACIKLCTRALMAWGFTPAEAQSMSRLDDEDLRILSLVVVGIDGMYDDDAIAWRWMEQKRRELGGITPKTAILEGPTGLERVHSLVRWEANR